MPSGGGGTNTITQANPPPQFMAAYQNAVNQAQTVAAQPYSPYPGGASSLVAGFSPDQLAGMAGVQNAQGIANPYINAASQYMSNATTPLWGSTQQFSPAAVSQYESPYTSQVVNATEQQFANTDAQQQNQLQGNAASQGALGGDRLGVEQGVLAGQQQSTQAPVIAGLENQGYTQALGEFNTQQQAQLGANEANSWLNSQAGFGMANLGSEAQNSALSGASALLNTGSLQQGLAQANLNVPYEQYVAQQAYPFQTTGWMANIAEGLGSQAGGSSTSTTTAPPPNVAAGVGGLGLAAGGLGLQAYQAGLFGGGSGLGGALGSGLSASAMNGLSAQAAGNIAGGAAGLARGGSVPGYAFGGMTGLPGVMGRIKGPTGSTMQSSGVGANPMNQISTGLGLASDALKAYNVLSGVGAAAAPAGLAAAPATAAGANGILMSGPGMADAIGSTTAAAAPALAGTAAAAGGGAAEAGGALTAAVAGGATTAAAAGTGATVAAALPFLAMMRRGGSVPQRASGGPAPMLPAGMSMAPGAYAGAPEIPMLPTGGMAGATGATAQPVGLADYLAATQAKAPTAAQLSALAPKAAAPPPAAPSQATIDQLVQQALAQQQNPMGSMYAPSYTESARGGMIRPQYAAGGGMGNPGAPSVPTDQPQAGMAAPDSTYGIPVAPSTATDADADLSQLGGDQDRMNLGDVGREMTDVGLGIMAQRSPYALQDVGAGALAGMHQFQTTEQAAKSLHARVAQARAQIAATTQRNIVDAEREQDTRDYNQARIGIAQGQAANTAHYHDLMAGTAAASEGVRAKLASIEAQRVNGELSNEQALLAERKVRDQASATQAQAGIKAKDQATKARIVSGYLATHVGATADQAAAFADRIMNGGAPPTAPAQPAQPQPAALRPAQPKPGTTGAPSFPGAPPVGTVQGGYRYIGGDPGVPSSWNQVPGTP